MPSFIPKTLLIQDRQCELGGNNHVFFFDYDFDYDYEHEHGAARQGRAVTRV